MVNTELIAKFSVGVILGGALSNFLGDLEDTILTPNVRYYVDKTLGEDNKKLGKVDLNKLITQTINLIIVFLFFMILVKIGIAPLWAPKR